MLRFVATALLSLLPACSSGGDPDRDIEGGGVIAAGWQLRFDKAESQRKNIRLVPVPGGLEAENGPNAIFWRKENQATGRYRLSLDVHHLDSHEHPHGAGLIFGGAELAGEAQTYTYFLVRGDGRYLVKKRNGKETEELTPWKDHAAIRKEADKGGAKNRLVVEVDVAEVRFLINDQMVHQAARSTVHADGLYGLRIVHNLKVRYLGLRREPLPSK